MNREENIRTDQADMAVVDCGQLVTMAGPARPRVGAELSELGVQRDATLLVKGGRVMGSAPYALARQHIGPDTQVVEAKGALVTPGFVDAHTHPVFGGDRADEFDRRIAGESYQQIAAQGGGIASTVARTRALTEDQLCERTKERLRWFVAGGTTTIEAKSGYGLSLAEELKALRALRDLSHMRGVRIVATVLAAHTVPAEYRGHREEYVRLVTEEILPAVAAQKLAQFADVFCDDNGFSLAETEQVLRAARELGLGLRAHVEQFSADGSAALAAELGAVTVDHLEAARAESFAVLRACGTQPVLLPASVYCLGKDRYADARGMIAAGLAPVLATDFNPGSSPTTSMPFVMSLACVRMRMTPAEALCAATVNAARSLGLGAECGSLEHGRSADFCVWPFRDYREIAYWAAVPAQPRVFLRGVAADVALSDARETTF